MSFRSLLTSFYDLFDSILNIFFPHVCISCEQKIDDSKELYCLECQHQARITDLHQYKTNQFTEHFPTLSHLHSGCAMYFYIKGGRVQQALELLKYKNKADIGKRLGLHYGHLLKKSDIYNIIQFIIPVPLHTKKLALRGYNQSEYFAMGLAESMNATVQTEIIYRRKDTKTQTEKNRMERIENMRQAFYCKSSFDLNDRYVLLVDDILTTGATLQSCAEVLIEKYPNVKLYMATIAIGNN